MSTVAAEWREVYGGHSSQTEEDSITMKELLPVVLACATWGMEWADSMVVVHCDKEGAVSAVNSGYSKVPQIMHLLSLYGHATE